MVSVAAYSLGEFLVITYAVPFVMLFVILAWAVKRMVYDEVMTPVYYASPALAVVLGVMFYSDARVGTLMFAHGVMWTFFALNMWSAMKKVYEV